MYRPLGYGRPIIALPRPPRFLRTERRGADTYEIFSAVNAEKGRAFLQSQHVDGPGRHIVVETPDGTWGKDLGGLYLERIRDWQVDLAATDCLAADVRPQDDVDLARAAAGTRDNFISIIRCGKCAREWYDGVRYQEITLAQCPRCLKFNAVDTRHLSAHRNPTA